MTEITSHDHESRLTSHIGQSTHDAMYDAMYDAIHRPTVV